MTSLALVLFLAAAPDTVSLEFHGTLREALQHLAKDGKLNLVVTGPLDVPAEVMLTDVRPEDALRTVAKAYGLEVTQEGTLFVLRPAAQAPVAPAPAVAPVPPVLPPAAVAQPSAAAVAEQLKAEAEAAAERAEAARDQAEEARDRAQELREAQRDQVKALKEEAKAKAEEARARAEESKLRSTSVSHSGPVTVHADEELDSVVSWGGPVTVEDQGKVKGDVVAFGGDVVLKPTAQVGGDAVSFGGTVVREPGAKVGGQVVSFGGSGLGQAVAARAVGAARPPSSPSGAGEASALALFLLQFASLFGLGFVLMMFAPQRMKAIEAELSAAPVRNGVIGLLATVASVPLTLFLILTVVGIPVALVFWVLAALAVVASLVVLSNLLGARLPAFRLKKTQASALALGILAMLLLSRIPVLGPLVVGTAVTATLGAIVRTRFGQTARGSLPVADLDPVPLA
ncbi:MAG: EI24 domain-containing protein [Myxococcaceae bacterium]|nr:EI24 domain-containing protein [Myxococcaceae bacterium]